jgi:hypothetical protein
LGVVPHGQHLDRDRSQAGVGLDLLEHFAGVLARQIEVEQHQVRPGGVGVPISPMQEVERLDSVGHDVQFVAHLVELADQEDVTGVVLDKKDDDHAQRRLHGVEILLGAALAPSPGPRQRTAGAQALRPFRTGRRDAWSACPSPRAPVWERSGRAIGVSRRRPRASA